MKRKRFTEEQIIGVLKEHDLGAKTSDLTAGGKRYNQSDWPIGILCKNYPWQQR